MPLLALFLLLVFLAVTFPIRSLIRRQMFGAAARDNYLEARPASWWVADLLFAAAFALLLAGPVGDLLGFWSMFFDPPLWLWLPASAVAALAILLVIWSQRTMGAAWRPAISPVDGAGLVTSGPFELVRNPNYVAMLLVGAASLFIGPSIVGIAGMALLFTSLVFTVRAEEPLLEQSYGDQYRSYCARTGRFTPWTGLISETETGWSTKTKTKG